MVEHRIHHSIAYLDDSVANSQDLRGVSSRGDPDLPFALPWWIKQRLQPGIKALHTCWPFALGCQHLQGYNHFALISSKADLLRATSLAWARSLCEEAEITLQRKSQVLSRLKISCKQMPQKEV